MAKIIREKYEDGVLVSREIENSGVSYLKVARLFIESLIAVSVATIAVLSLMEGPSFEDIHGPAGMSRGACSKPDQAT
jgi:hypothetical protein